MSINWLRCIANGGTAFFTTLAGVEIVSFGDLKTKMAVSLVSATVQFGVAFFREMKAEADKNSQAPSYTPKKYRKAKPKLNIFNYMLVW